MLIIKISAIYGPLESLSGKKVSEGQEIGVLGGSNFKKMTSFVHI
jgi:hypothetical protein